MIGRFPFYINTNLSFDKFKKEPELKLLLIKTLLNIPFKGVGEFVSELPALYFRIVGPFKGRNTIGFSVITKSHKIFQLTWLALNSLKGKNVTFNGDLVVVKGVFVSKNRKDVFLLNDLSEFKIAPTGNIIFNTPTILNDFNFLGKKDGFHIFAESLKIKKVQTAFGSAITGKIEYMINGNLTKASDYLLEKFFSGVGENTKLGFGDILIKPFSNE